ncbi:peptidylprolyl isomerase [Zavarzinia aquatilis]|uniref:Parvulin-like PPIase n=1 Tax=Zavarzinia aquatilis TaxID=2211142 RepID=A0A317ECK7_9PROT|nr:peptidylprolyl isomerase [Zavarzinia aquatilis]PWR24768.1 peptidylprolyl isomerase [Zavarzinia aquatilis]
MQRLNIACLLALGLVSVQPAFAEGTAATPAPAAAPAEDPVVARVGDQEIHRSEVVEAYKSLPEQFAQIPMDAIFGELLQQLVDRRVMALDAAKKGYGDDPEVKRKVELLKERVMEETYVSREIEASITDAMMKAKYDKIIADNPAEEEVRARHILVDSEEEAKKLKAELDKGADFAELANKNSKDARDGSGGDLGYFTRERMVPEFAEAAFAAEVGKVVGPVKSQFGWHLILVEDKRKQAPPPFEDVKPQLKDMVAQELTAARVDELKKGVKIELLNADGSVQRPQIAPAQ